MENYYQSPSAIGCLYLALPSSFEPNGNEKRHRKKSTEREEHPEKGPRAKYNLELIVGSK